MPRLNLARRRRRVSRRVLAIRTTLAVLAIGLLAWGTAAASSVGRGSDSITGTTVADSRQLHDPATGSHSHRANATTSSSPASSASSQSAPTSLTPTMSTPQRSSSAATSTRFSIFPPAPVGPAPAATGSTGAAAGNAGNAANAGNRVASAPRVVSSSAAAASAVGGSGITLTAYVTGYGYFDNTPPGSSAVSNPVLHSVAGGTGTYADPITVAVGHSTASGHDVLDYPAGTRFYIAGLHRYFIVEDSCGDGPDPQDEPCNNLSQADQGAQLWLDIWTGGQGGSQSLSNSCSSQITRNYTVIRDPASNLPVISPPGPLNSGSACRP
jgi:hypothetical protein